MWRVWRGVEGVENSNREVQDAGDPCYRIESNPHVPSATEEGNAVVRSQLQIISLRAPSAAPIVVGLHAAASLALAVAHGRRSEAGVGARTKSWAQGTYQGNQKAGPALHRHRQRRCPMVPETYLPEG